MFFSVLISLLEVLLITVPMLMSVAFITIGERKTMASMQRRLGPNIVGYYGILQAFADALKLLLKEYISPTQANWIIFFLGPIITLIFSLLGFGVIPFGTGMAIIDFNLGILYMLAVSSLSTYGILLAGWSANSKYAFLGSLRSTAQLISYELILSSAILLVILFAGSLNITVNVEAQRVIWFIIPLLPVFVVFFIGSVAETNRAPFDLAEAESELVSGFMTEHSAVIFVFFFLAEYASILLICILINILFLGGYLLDFTYLIIIINKIMELVSVVSSVIIYVLLYTLLYAGFFFKSSLVLIFNYLLKNGLTYFMIDIIKSLSVFLNYVLNIDYTDVFNYISVKIYIIMSLNVFFIYLLKFNYIDMYNDLIRHPFLGKYIDFNVASGFNYYAENIFNGFIFGLKSCLMVFIFIWVRASYPRIRFDQLMSFCWTILLPIVIGFIILIPCIIYSCDMLSCNVGYMLVFLTGFRYHLSSQKTILTFIYKICILYTNILNKPPRSFSIVIYQSFFLSPTLFTNDNDNDTSSSRKRELEDEESLEDESLDDYIKRQNFDSYTLDKLDQRKERSEILDIFESGKPALKKLRKNQDLNEDEDKALEPFRNGRYADQELGGNKFAREYDRDHEHALKLLNKNASDLESLGVSHRDIALPSTEDPLSDLDSSYSDAESVSTESDQSKLFAKPDVKHAHDNLISAKDQVDMSQSANTSLDKVKNNEPLNRQDLDNLSQYCYPGQNEQLNTKLDNNVTDPNSMFPDPQDFVNQADQVNKESRQLFRTVAEEFTDLADRAVSPHTYVDQHNWDSTYVTPLSELESSEDPVDPSEPESSVGPAASGSSNDFLLSESSGEELLIAEEDSVESSSKKHKVEDDSHNDDGNSNNGDDNSDNGDDNSDNGDNNLENGDDNSDNVDDDSRNTNGGISKGDSDLGKSEFSISNQFLNSVLIRILDIILILIKAAFGDDELPFDDD